MKISAKAEYACLAMLELALRFGRADPVRLAEIAQPHGIPERFLVQILLQLKGAGYVRSTRGAAGGYRLAVEPQEITLWNVIHVIDGPATPAGLGDAGASSAGANVLRGVWREANRREEDFLSQTNFAQLVEQAREQPTNMYYI